MQVVVFKIHGQDYAVNIQSVKEIIRMTPITKVPKSEESVKGIINLRGTVTPIVSLYEKFDIEEMPMTDQSRIIILSIEDHQVGVIVDSVTQVISIREEDIQDTKVKLALDESFIKGIAKLEGRLLVILKVDEILSGVIA